MEDIFGNIWIFLLLLITVPFSIWCFYIWTYEVLIKGLLDWMNPSRVIDRHKELRTQLTRQDEFLVYQDLNDQKEIDRQQQIEDQEKQATVKKVRQDEWIAFNKMNR